MTGLPFADDRAVNLFMISGVIGLAIGDTFMFLALGRLGAHRAALLASMGPIFAALFAWLFRGEVLGFGQIPGIGAAVGGVTLVVAARPHGSKVGEPEPRNIDWTGVMWGVLAAIGQAGGVVVSKEAFATADVPLLSAVLRLGAGTAALALFALFRRELHGQVTKIFRPAPLRRLAVATFFGTFCGIWLMQVGISWTGSAIASALHSMTPIFTLAIAVFVLRERPTKGVLAGSVLAVTGVTLLLVL